MGKYTEEAIRHLEALLATNPDLEESIKQAKIALGGDLLKSSEDVDPLTQIKVLLNRGRASIDQEEIRNIITKIGDLCQNALMELENEPAGDDQGDNQGDDGKDPVMDEEKALLHAAGSAIYALAAFDSEVNAEHCIKTISDIFMPYPDKANLEAAVEYGQDLNLSMEQAPTQFIETKRGMSLRPIGMTYIRSIAEVRRNESVYKYAIDAIKLLGTNNNLVLKIQTLPDKDKDAQKESLISILADIAKLIKNDASAQKGKDGQQQGQQQGDQKDAEEQGDVNYGDTLRFVPEVLNMLVKLVADGKLDQTILIPQFVLVPFDNDYLVGMSLAALSKLSQMQGVDPMLVANSAFAIGMHAPNCIQAAMGVMRQCLILLDNAGKGYSAGSEELKAQDARTMSVLRKYKELIVSTMSEEDRKKFYEEEDKKRIEALKTRTQRLKETWQQFCKESDDNKKRELINRFHSVQYRDKDSAELLMECLAKTDDYTLSEKWNNELIQILSYYFENEDMTLYNDKVAKAVKALLDKKYISLNSLIQTIAVRTNSESHDPQRVVMLNVMKEVYGKDMDYTLSSPYFNTLLQPLQKASTVEKAEIILAPLNDIIGKMPLAEGAKEDSPVRAQIYNLCSSAPYTLKDTEARKTIAYSLHGIYLGLLDTKEIRQDVDLSSTILNVLYNITKTYLANEQEQLDLIRADIAQRLNTWKEEKLPISSCQRLMYVINPLLPEEDELEYDIDNTQPKTKKTSTLIFNCTPNSGFFDAATATLIANDKMSEMGIGHDRAEKANTAVFSMDNNRNILYDCANIDAACQYAKEKKPDAAIIVVNAKEIYKSFVSSNQDYRERTSTLNLYNMARFMNKESLTTKLLVLVTGYEDIEEQDNEEGRNQIALHMSMHADKLNMTYGTQVRFEKTVHASINKALDNNDTDNRKVIMELLQACDALVPKQSEPNS